MRSPISRRSIGRLVIRSRVAGVIAFVLILGGFAESALYPAFADAPDAPTDVSTVAQDSRAWVTWTAPTGTIDHYTITATDTTGADSGQVVTATALGSSTGWTIANLKDSDTYTITVKATNDADETSAASTSTSVTPLEAGRLTQEESNFTFPTNGGPGVTRVSPDGQYVYVGTDGGVVYVVGSGVNGSLLHTITVSDGNNIRALAVSPDGRYVYATVWNANQVAQIDTSTWTVTDTISVGNAPTGLAIAPDGKELWVSNATSGTVSVIDLASWTVTDTIATGGTPHGIAFTPNGSEVYVADEVGGNPAPGIFVIDANTHEVTTVSLGLTVAVQQVSLSSDGQYAYFSSEDGGVIVAVQTSDNSLVAAIPVGQYPESVTVAPNNKRIYSARWLSDTISAVDLGTNTAAAGIATTSGNYYGMDISPDGQYGYAADYSGSFHVYVASSTEPLSVTASAGNATATVGWHAPTNLGSGGAITSYTVTAHDTTDDANGGQTVTTADGSTLTADFTGLTNGDDYYFTVVATNDNGDSADSVASPTVTPLTTPGAPTDVAATSDGGGAQVDVTWTAPDDGGTDITGYTITAYNETASTSSTTTVDGTTTATTLSGLTKGDTYHFTVYATNTLGDGTESDPSNTITPLTVPGYPANVTAIANDSSATVSWTSPSDDGGTPITSYTITAVDYTNALNGGQTVTTVDGTARSTTITGLTNGDNYILEVSATNTVGDSGALPSNNVTPSATPGSPTDVSATVHGQQATVTWTAPLDGGTATSYIVNVYDETSSTTTQVTEPSSPATIGNLIDGHIYHFTVVATNTAGSSSASDESNAITVPSPTSNNTSSDTNTTSSTTSDNTANSNDSPTNDGTTTPATPDTANNTSTTSNDSNTPKNQNNSTDKSAKAPINIAAIITWLVVAAAVIILIIVLAKHHKRDTDQ